MMQIQGWLEELKDAEKRFEQTHSSEALQDIIDCRRVLADAENAGIKRWGKIQKKKYKERRHQHEHVTHP